MYDYSPLWKTLKKNNTISVHQRVSFLDRHVGRTGDYSQSSLFIRFHIFSYPAFSLIPYRIKYCELPEKLTLN